ncbi:radical SAM protein [bacterium]|nr:radical SAM protein [candidate division CSSED10-310 bacterium]
MTARVVTFITPTPPDISAFGVRALSAWLKHRGHTVRCIFLPGGIDHLTHSGTYRYVYPPDIVAAILDITAGSDLVAFSFMSQYRDRAIQLTQAVRQAQETMTVWGGIHAEVDPADGLNHADAVCLCEGETVLEELLNAMDGSDRIAPIRGLLTRSQPDPGAAGPLPHIDDLDSLPWMDMGPENHFVLDPLAHEILPLTPPTMQRILPLMPAPGGGALTVFRTMTSRGCPHRCTYCANRIRAEQFPGPRYLRFRSPDHVMGELLDVTRRFPFIQGIHFFDDVFTAMPANDLERVCRRLKEEIGLPWYAQASPSTLTREQLDMFVETGLVFIEMGIQTGSERIRQMYHRPESNERILDGVHRVHAYRHRLLKPHYHVILDNPWETRDDVRATLELLTRIPGEFQLCLASLTLYPGTDLARKALDEGLLTDFDRQVYRKPFFIPKGRYLNYLIYLTDIRWIPRRLLRFLGKAPATILDRPVFGPLFDILRRITDKMRLIGKGLQALRTGQFHRIRNYFRRVR